MLPCFRGTCRLHLQSCSEQGGREASTAGRWSLRTMGKEERVKEFLGPVAGQ